MTVEVDNAKGSKAARLLYDIYSSKGIFEHSGMPFDILPHAMVRGSIEHILFITLTVALQYQRDINKLWEASRKTIEDNASKYLFCPEEIYKTPLEQILQDMKRYGLSKNHERDAKSWKTIGSTLQIKWGGNPVNILKHYEYNALHIINALKESKHLEGEKYVYDFPFLRGDKIGPLWIKMLVYNAGVSELKHLDMIPIPVDIHVARSSLALGIVKGKYRGSAEGIFKEIRDAWTQSIRGIIINGRNMIPLDLDEPLWHLSKYGCAKRDKGTGTCSGRDKCMLKELCTSGTIKIEGGKIDMDTV